MDWDGSNNSLRSFVSLTDHSSIGFLYDFNNNHFPSNSAGAILMGDDRPHHEAHVGILANYGNNHHLQHLHRNNNQKKKKLQGDQLELLERSFQEEIKLDPDRKLRLSRELSLQPRQIAVWFQNRRARWKAKQLEWLYEVLKLEFDAVSREKLKLQEEVLRLKAMLGGDAMLTDKQASAASQTEILGEETARSARHSDEVLPCSTTTDLMMNAKVASHHHHHHLASESGDQLSNVHKSYSSAAAMNTYWGGSLPSYP